VRHKKRPEQTQLMTFTADTAANNGSSLRKDDFSRIFNNNARTPCAMMTRRLPSLRGNRLGRHLKLNCIADNRKLVNFAVAHSPATLTQHLAAAFNAQTKFPRPSDRARKRSGFSVPRSRATMRPRRST